MLSTSSLKFSFKDQNLKKKMSQPPSQCMSASNEEEISLKQIAFDLRALLRWKEDEIIAREREKQERDRFHQLLDEERRGQEIWKGCMRG